LVVDFDEKLRIQDADLPEAPTAASWSSHFFTGSAPHFVRIEIPTGEKAGTPAHVTFSEPINLGDLTGEPVMFDGTKPISACVRRGAECFQGEMWMSESASISLTVSQLPATLTLVLPGKVMGSGRKVSESRHVTSQVDPHADGLRLSVAHADFKAEPGVSLWIEQVPPPAKKP
jgi:hypothetical protein